MQAAQWWARLGAICYIVWGFYHLNAAYVNYQLAAQTTGMVHGRLMQEVAYTLMFALTAMVLAVLLNWRNSWTGYWLNALIIGLGDVPFMIYVLAPGYLPLWPGVVGPVLWVAGFLCTTFAWLTARSERATLSDA